jgi:Zn ribbon nucleic-acid-binding protein
MGNRFSSAKHSIAECDRCGFRYKLKELKKLTIKTKLVSIKVCPNCWEQDQPQLQLGMYPVQDPQAVREPRRDNSYQQAGYTGLQLTLNTDFGDPSGGSRIFQWGWRPVGGSSSNDAGLTPNALTSRGVVGSVTIT